MDPIKHVCAFNLHPTQQAEGRQRHSLQALQPNCCSHFTCFIYFDDSFLRRQKRMETDRKERKEVY